MFTFADVVKGVIVSLIVTTIIKVGNSFVRSFKESKNNDGDDRSIYTEAYVKLVKREFKIVYLLAVGIAIALIVIKPDTSSFFAIFLYVVGFFSAFFTFTTFYCLDDVIDQLRKQIGNQPAQDAANDTSTRDISV